MWPLILVTNSYLQPVRNLLWHTPYARSACFLKPTNKLGFQDRFTLFMRNNRKNDSHVRENLTKDIQKYFSERPFHLLSPIHPKKLRGNRERKRKERKELLPPPWHIVMLIIFFSVVSYTFTIIYNPFKQRWAIIYIFSTKKLHLFSSTLVMTIINIFRC